MRHAEDFHGGALRNPGGFLATFRLLFCCSQAGSGVLLRPEIPLVIEPFFSNSALVMVAVRRSARCRAVLRGRIMRRLQVAGARWIGRSSSGLGRNQFGWIKPRLTLR